MTASTGLPWCSGRRGERPVVRLPRDSAPAQLENLNFAGLGEEKEELVKAGYGANYERLAMLKAKYDPANLFCMNLNITPAS